LPSNNLPLQLTSFIGRERQIAEARKILQSTHLLTLTGAGGNGKTRLALAVAESLLEDYPDGIWLVELASLSDPALIPQAIASALGVRESPGRPVTQTLEVYLKTKQALLLLDNCEHLIDPCARLAHAVLSACPNLQILATSREPLHIAGEVTWLVPPLSLPNLQQLPPLEELARVEAVRLFIERARSSLPAFAMDRQNALPIAQVCCRLGGLPLGAITCSLIWSKSC
jgi:predicted ATPase